MTALSKEELRTLCEAAARKHGLRQEDTAIMLDHYLENEYAGKQSHGLIRVVEAIKAAIKYGPPNQDPEIEWDQDTILRLNAHRQIGVVAAWHALQLGLKRAQSHGVTFVGVRDYIASTGSMSYYLKHIAKQNLIGLMGCNSVSLVAPQGSKKRMLGTNPFGIAIPSQDERDMIADFATSAIAYGKIMVMNDQGKDIPEGVLIDKNGMPSTNPEDAYNGAILPLADYRGFSLGLLIELLAGPLIGAKAHKQELYDNDGLYMILLNPQKFGNPDILEQITQSLSSIRNSPKAPSISEISLPGDRSRKNLERSMKNTQITVVDQTLDNLKALL